MMIDCSSVDRRNEFTKALSDNWLSCLKPLNQQIIDSFTIYYEYLLQENEKFNLTRVLAPYDAAMKHFVDSAAGSVFFIDDNVGRVLDIGAGAGFPGMPLKILFPQLKLTIVDASAKRLRFIERIIKLLAIEDVDIQHARCEDLARKMQYRERFNWVVARAVANLPVLLEYAMPFLHCGGSLLAWKGPRWIEEWQQAEKAAKVLSTKLIETRNFALTVNADEHCVLNLQKTNKTASIYPRKAGTITKSPL